MSVYSFLFADIGMLILGFIKVRVYAHLMAFSQTEDWPVCLDAVILCLWNITVSYSTMHKTNEA